MKKTLCAICILIGILSLLNSEIVTLAVLIVLGIAGVSRIIGEY